MPLSHVLFPQGWGWWVGVVGDSLFDLSGGFVHPNGQQTNKAWLMVWGNSRCVCANGPNEGYIQSSTAAKDTTHETAASRGHRLRLFQISHVHSNSFLLLLILLRNKKACSKSVLTDTFHPIVKHPCCESAEACTGPHYRMKIHPLCLPCHLRAWFSVESSPRHRQIPAFFWFTPGR